MMQGAQVKLIPGLSWLSTIQQGEEIFHQQLVLKFQKETFGA